MERNQWKNLKIIEINGRVEELEIKKQRDPDFKVLVQGPSFIQNNGRTWHWGKARGWQAPALRRSGREGRSRGRSNGRGGYAMLHGHSAVGVFVWFVLEKHALSQCCYFIFLLFMPPSLWSVFFFFF